MGCRVCRARKVKCDERPNRCMNCERLDLECVGWGPISPTVTDESLLVSHISTTARTRRTYRSCKGCRIAKTKCDGNRPQCSRCKVKAIDCLYDAGPKPFWAQILARQSQSPTGDRSHADLITRFDPVPAGLRTEDERRSSPLPTHQEGNRENASSLQSPTTSVVQDDVDQSSSETLSWLQSPRLPSSPRLIRQLVEQYFKNVHPLRCFAFLHKPSFMRQLDQELRPNKGDNALLHIVCAHGAKFYALEHYLGVYPPPAQLIHTAGNEWAQNAERIIMSNYGKISMSNLMATVLLYDYQFRLGNYAQAFILSGFITRMAHALQLNLESPADAPHHSQSTTFTEARRRVMWACYILDAWTGSGVDQLTLLHSRDIQIQLPCNERSFLLRIPCVTETLEQFDNSSARDKSMGLVAYYIRLIALWKRVARYVKCLNTSQPPWLPESEFAILDADLRHWRRQLPTCLDFSQENIYIRLESSQLGALALLHCTFHHIMFDFYRISMPELFQLQYPVDFPPEQADFLELLQSESLHHAWSVSSILAETAHHGPRFLADSMLPCFIYNSNRIMLYYIARILDPNRQHAKGVAEETIRHIQSNNDVLQTISVMLPLAGPLHVAADRWLRRVRTSLSSADPLAHIGPQDPSEVHDPTWSRSGIHSILHSTPDQVLNPLSLYRLARKTVSEEDPEHGAQPLQARGSTSVVTENDNLDEPSNRQPYLTPHQRETRPANGLSSSVPEQPVAQQALYGEDRVLAHAIPGAIYSTPLSLPVIAESADQDSDGLDLNELFYYPPWDLDGIASMSGPGTEDSGLAAWLGASERAEHNTSGHLTS